jgi:hypothetical protein
VNLGYRKVARFSSPHVSTGGLELPIPPNLLTLADGRSGRGELEGDRERVLAAGRVASMRGRVSFWHLPRGAAGAN